MDRETKNEIWRHDNWIQPLQPTGLVIGARALVGANLFFNNSDLDLWRRFVALATAAPAEQSRPAVFRWPPLPTLLQNVLDYRADELVTDVAPEHGAYYEAYATHVQPDGYVTDGHTPLLYFQYHPDAENLDHSPEARGAKQWPASPMRRFTWLMGTRNVPMGLLACTKVLRFIYAPVGESVGYMDFPIDDLVQTRGRDCFFGLHQILKSDILFNGTYDESTLGLLVKSRKHQNDVSETLGIQVKQALIELLVGFHAANPRLLQDVDGDAGHIYEGLLKVVMRLVFILYTEDQGLVHDDPLYAQHYSLGNLFTRLEADNALYPDTMEQRFGAYSQLITLFRLIYHGNAATQPPFPKRGGDLFNAALYPFLEGFGGKTPLGKDQLPENGHCLPDVSDGVVYRVLKNLLVLDGERLSYRTLDVEQIGSIYEGMMGFEVQVAKGPSVPVGRFGVVVDLQELLDAKAGDRIKILAAEGVDIKGKTAAALKKAADLDTLELELAAAGKLTPHPDGEHHIYRNRIPAGGLFLQPGEERRKTGSHYTPRALTHPIVTHTLEPVLAGLGPHPRAAEILKLKVCDPAMGSGAFLVETCRFLADQVVDAWAFHRDMPDIPADEQPVIHARRLVANRCLYGVDKNPFAAALAKLSLWLITFAKDHPFTFLDHALRHGDSLLGLTRNQVGGFNWVPEQRGPLFDQIAEPVATIRRARKEIHDLGDGDVGLQHEAFRRAEDQLEVLRMAGDTVLAAFFAGKNAKDRGLKLAVARDRMSLYRDGAVGLAEMIHHLADFYGPPYPQHPFHWDMEFPEVFTRLNPGFDAFVGNPPFAGKNNLLDGSGKAYQEWILMVHAPAHGNADLAAHFFRQAFRLLRKGGSFGLIATNTIGQGDTRDTGLAWICENGGTIYHAQRRMTWPGAAAVVVSVVHVAKERTFDTCTLDGKTVPRISAFLVPGGFDRTPPALEENLNESYQGAIVLGIGFTFDDSDKTGKASPLALKDELILKDPRNAERIFPYIGGKEVNSSPTHAPHRYVINFESMSEKEAKNWPDLFEVIEKKVKPERLTLKRKSYRDYWWQYAEKRSSLFNRLKTIKKVLVTGETATYITFTILPSDIVFSHKLRIITSDRMTTFSILQSTPHTSWALLFSSSMKDDPNYSHTDCFENFPFPPNWQTNNALEIAGQRYYDCRAQLMIANNEGLTKTYHRFHDPNNEEPEIAELRRLHRAMDRAVADAYGWADLDLRYVFEPDYLDEEGHPKRIRYRWPDDLHDEVLGRLMALNQERHLADLRAEEAAAKTAASKGTQVDFDEELARRDAARKGLDASGPLFGTPEGTDD